MSTYTEQLYTTNRELVATIETLRALISELEQENARLAEALAE